MCLSPYFDTRFCYWACMARSMLEIQFLRENFIKAEVAQLDRKGNLVQGRRSRRPKRGTPQTVTLTWKDGETGALTTQPFTSYALARKVSGGPPVQ